MIPNTSTFQRNEHFLVELHIYFKVWYPNLKLLRWKLCSIKQLSLEFIELEKSKIEKASIWKWFLPIYFLFLGPYDIFSFHKKFFHLLLWEHSMIFPTECHLSAKMVHFHSVVHGRHIFHYYCKTFWESTISFQCTSAFLCNSLYFLWE